MFRKNSVVLVIVFITTPLLPQSLEYNLEIIDGLRIYETVDRLASDEFHGRLTGHQGFNEAANWVADMFEEWGFTPVDEAHEFLLPFPVEYTLINEASMSVYLVDEEKETGYREKKLRLETEFLPLLYSDSGDNTAEVVFVGWGIHAPDIGYDDYFGVDVEGKFVMCFRGTPNTQDRRFQYHDEHRTRMQRAKDEGALGLIYIYEEPIANPNGNWIQGFTPVKISYNIADKLLGERGFDSATLRQDLLKYNRPISFPLESKVRIQVESTHYPDGTGYNVAGYVEGSNPELRDEVIVVGAHLDHCGTHMGLLFPGANDNASGSAVVIEIARAFAENEIETARPVMFTLFGGEEMGLIGSRYLVEHFPEHFTEITNMINIDMVGTGNGVYCGFSADHTELKELVEGIDTYIQIVDSFFPIRDIGVRLSDYEPFHIAGIPVLDILSNGPHIDIHRTGDTIYRLNPSVMENVALIGYLLAIELGNTQ